MLPATFVTFPPSNVKVNSSAAPSAKVAPLIVYSVSLTVVNLSEAVSTVTATEVLLPLLKVIGVLFAPCVKTIPPEKSPLISPL